MNKPTEEISLSEQVTEFIEVLHADELTCIYLGGARLWLDISEQSLAITYGPPDEDDLHEAEMAELACFGPWVWAPLDWAIAEEHPKKADGEIDFDWPGMAPWKRERLLASAEDVAADLQLEEVLFNGMEDCEMAAGGRFMVPGREPGAKRTGGRAL